MVLLLFFVSVVLVAKIASNRARFLSSVLLHCLRYKRDIKTHKNG